jgi:hypothetical protein
MKTLGPKMTERGEDWLGPENLRLFSFFFFMQTYLWSKDTWGLFSPCLTMLNNHAHKQSVPHLDIDILVCKNLNYIITVKVIYVLQMCFCTSVIPVNGHIVRPVLLKFDVIMWLAVEVEFSVEVTITFCRWKFKEPLLSFHCPISLSNES